MATPQLSPGVLTREVDLTVGRADNILDNIGAIAGPFEIGPVEEATKIATEQDEETLSNPNTFIFYLNMLVVFNYYIWVEQHQNLQN